MKLKTKSGAIYDDENHPTLQNLSSDDILELVRLHRKMREVKKK